MTQIPDPSMFPGCGTNTNNTSDTCLPTLPATYSGSTTAISIQPNGIGGYFLGTTGGMQKSISVAQGGTSTPECFTFNIGCSKEISRVTNIAGFIQTPSVLRQIGNTLISGSFPITTASLAFFPFGAIKESSENLIRFTNASASGFSSVPFTASNYTTAEFVGTQFALVAVSAPVVSLSVFDGSTQTFGPAVTGIGTSILGWLILDQTRFLVQTNLGTYICSRTGSTVSVLSSPLAYALPALSGTNASSPNYAGLISGNTYWFSGTYFDVDFTALTITTTTQPAGSVGLSTALGMQSIFHQDSEYYYGSESTQNTFTGIRKVRKIDGYVVNRILNPAIGSGNRALASYHPASGRVLFYGDDGVAGPYGLHGAAIAYIGSDNPQTVGPVVLPYSTITPVGITNYNLENDTTFAWFRDGLSASAHLEAKKIVNDELSYDVDYTVNGVDYDDPSYPTLVLPSPSSTITVCARVKNNSAQPITVTTTSGTFSISI